MARLKEDHPLWINKNKDMRIIDLSLEDSSEREVFKEGRTLFLTQIDMAHAIMKGQDSSNSEWITLDYSTSFEKAKETLEEQQKMLINIMSLLDQLGGKDGELVKAAKKKLIPEEDKLSKEEDPNLN